MSNKTKKVSFYQELTNDKNQISLLELQTKNGIARIENYIPSSTTVDKKIIIHAKLESSLGHPFKTKNTYHLQLDTH